MIEIQYTMEGIKVITNELSKIFPKKSLPLTVSISKYVSGETIWSTKLGDFMWASFPDTEMKNVTIHDAQGNLVKKHVWDVFEHGSIFYRSLWLYCKKILNEGRQPNGLAIGTHDGEFGEWVPVARQFLSDITLVEASQNQYEKLSSNFKEQKNITLRKELVSIDGGLVEFFEGGEGYTNSIVERVIRSWEKDEIRSTERESISLNSLVEQSDTKFDWFHLDVEGLDANLLMSLEKENIPDFIIFEDYNLSNDDRNKIIEWIDENEFKSHSEGGICLLTR